jgi:DNA-binding MarR family transcriptional regulator
VPDRPVPPPPSAAFLIMGLGRLVRDDVDEVLGGHGLSVRHLSALGHLSGEPGLSYSELGRRAGVTAQSMQATLRQLEDRGAVERRTAPGRGRTAELHVTAAGADLLALGRRVMAQADERLLAGVPAERHAELVEVLLAAFAGAARRRGARAGTAT